ncbi:uncharacterized protein RAG0_16388 [Rhynchosporium agropyri]|uniref:Uncharacterized protein n=1 Tax=Rhynchosporium agropyri TaxID=914238 RepID=A0A1E1LQ55_9HELO|nr:uncharacterized protein RAG0_16388 [Rhynchosporium agropyri]
MQPTTFNYSMPYSEDQRNLATKTYEGLLAGSAAQAAAWVLGFSKNPPIGALWVL